MTSSQLFLPIKMSTLYWNQLCNYWRRPRRICQHMETSIIFPGCTSTPPPPPPHMIHIQNVQETHWRVMMTADCLSCVDCPPLSCVSCECVRPVQWLMTGIQARSQWDKSAIAFSTYLPYLLEPSLPPSTHFLVKHGIIPALFNGGFIGLLYLQLFSPHQLPNQPNLGFYDEEKV